MSRQLAEETQHMVKIRLKVSRKVFAASTFISTEDMTRNPGRQRRLNGCFATARPFCGAPRVHILGATRVACGESGTHPYVPPHLEFVAVCKAGGPPAIRTTTSR